MKTFYSTYDTAFKTWNVMDCKTGECLFYGNAWQVDSWVKNHKQFKEIL